MHNRECAICATPFQAKTERRGLCDACQKNPAAARIRMEKAVLDSRLRAGDHPSQKYHSCVCEHCGREFVSYGSRPRFCGNTCAGDSAAENAVCGGCGVKLLPLGIVSKNGRGTCSPACKELRRLITARRNDMAGICRQCGREFAKKKYWDECCGPACDKALTWANARAAGEVRPCAACGKEFIAKHEDSEACSMACRERIRKAAEPNIALCEVCGKEFTKHPNSAQRTCGKECSEFRIKRQAEKARRDAKAKRDAAKTGRGTQAGSGDGGKRADLIMDALANRLSDREVKSLHLCVACRTPQADCVMFTSGHVYHPKGAVTKAVGLSNVVLACPIYRA